MGWPKYSEEQIRYILMLGQTGVQPVDLSKRFGVPVVVINVWQTTFGSTLGTFDEARIRRLEREVTDLRRDIAELTEGRDGSHKPDKS